jgi:hypothetical protein
MGARARARGGRKPGRQATQRVPSSEIPSPIFRPRPPPRPRNAKEPIMEVHQGVRELIVAADLDALNVALEENQIRPEKIISVIWPG